MATSVKDSSKGSLQFSTVKLRLELKDNLVLGKVALYSTSNPGSTSSKRIHCKILNTFEENYVSFRSPMKFTMEIETTPQEFYDNVQNNWGNSNRYFIGPTVLELLKKISNDKIKFKYIQWLVAIYK